MRLAIDDQGQHDLSPRPFPKGKESLVPVSSGLLSCPKEGSGGDVMGYQFIVDVDVGWDRLAGLGVGDGADDVGEGGDVDLDGVLFGAGEED